MKTSYSDLRRQVGQLMMVGFEGSEATPHVQNVLRGIQPGGVILFARNIQTAPQCYSLLAECRKTTDVPIFTCVDLEGGTVDRLREVIAHAPSEEEVSHTGSKKLFRKHGALLGTEARALGFNVDFAPVSDLGYESARPVLGSRTVSPDPEETITFVHEFLAGMKSAGVLGCGKHFPGLGESTLDSHHHLPVIHKSWERLWAEDLLPYRKLHKQFPFAMVAHCAYPAVTGDSTPASLSKEWIMEILKKRIGFRGIALADDMEMGGVLAAESIDRAAVETVRAGSDMYLVCRKEEFILICFEAVLREAERDHKFAAMVAAAAQHVIRFKKAARELRSVALAPTEKTVQKLRKAMEDFKREVEKANAARQAS